MSKEPKWAEKLAFDKLNKVLTKDSASGQEALKIH
jgi:hypothetical protein